MDYNNRMPAYKEKQAVKRKIYHREIKDGKSVYVKGLAPDPYKDVSCESLKLKSRIDTGVFENHEGGPRHLEKAQGSDVMTAEIEKQKREFEERKKQAQINNERKKMQDLINNSVVEQPAKD